MVIQLILFFFISLAATTVGAISGIGGGVIIKPVMDAASGLGVSAVSFYSGCTVFSMAVVSLLRSRNSDVRVEPRRSTFLAIGAAAGGILGGDLFQGIRRFFGNESLVGAAQSGLLALITLGVFFFVRYRAGIHPLDVQNVPACAAIGLALGIISSFLGIGGGPINIAVLYYFLRMDSKTAALNSIYIILFSQSASLLRLFATGNVPAFDPPILLVMIAGGILGAFFGRSVSKKLSNEGVDRLFSGVMLLIIALSLYNFVSCLL